MTTGLKFATLVIGLIPLIVSGILAAPATPQVSSSNPGGDDVTSFLQSAKMHLTEATKNIKMNNSQAAIMQINMTRQAIMLAGLKLNTTIICNNIRNEGYCVAP
jgi:hypothetical protein